MKAQKDERLETFEEYAKANGFRLEILSRPVAPKDRDAMLAQYRQKDPHYMDQWRVRLSRDTDRTPKRTITSDYSKGIGLREGRADYRWPTRRPRFPQFWNKRLTLDDVDTMLACKPIDPTVGEILESLFLDASGADQSFENWAGDYGYDSDSIKAKGIYDLCRATRASLEAMADNFDDLYELEQS